MTDPKPLRATISAIMALLNGAPATIYYRAQVGQAVLTGLDLPELAKKLRKVGVKRLVEADNDVERYYFRTFKRKLTRLEREKLRVMVLGLPENEMKALGLA